MKKNLSKWSLFITFLMFLAISCNNADVSPEDSIVGTYKTINNPILCSLPTMADVNIKANGSTFKMRFKNTNTAKNEEISDIKVEKTDSTTRLLVKGIEMGTYTRMKYTDYSDGGVETIESMVLMLRFENDNKHYEFMGRK
jgi:hypothetical protein